MYVRFRVDLRANDEVALGSDQSYDRKRLFVAGLENLAH